MRSTNHAASSSSSSDDSTVALAPLLLAAEFDAEELEPEQAASSTGGVGVDLLNLKADPQLARFFEACGQEGKQEQSGSGAARRPDRALTMAHLPRCCLLFACSEGQNPAVHELLLMSCSGFRRDVDARLMAEARRPVVQAPEKSKADAPPAAASASSSDASVAAASTSAASAASPATTSARLSDWLRNKMKKDGNGAGSSDEREPASASPSPPSASSRASPSIAANSRSGPLQRHAPPARRHSQSLLPDDDPPPMSYSGSAAAPAKSSGRFAAPRAGGTLSSLSSASAALAADAERRLRQDRAPTAAPPSACTLLLTNVALYLLPPSVPVEIETDSSGRKRVKHFLVYNDYERIALQDVSLVSLPYRSGLTRHGTDFALRITDFCLHLRNGETSVWLQAPRNGRSMVVESLSDAFENLTGRALEMQQVDYADLIADVLSSATVAQPTSPGMPAVGRIPEAVHEAASAWWASRRFVRQGYLFHRSMHVYPAIVEAAESTAAAASSSSSAAAAPFRIEFRSAPATEWVHSFVGLTSDGRLMEFRSSQEFSSFAYVASAANQGKTTGKFPSRLELNAIDLSRASLFLRSAAANVAPDGFELIVYPRSSSMAAQPATSSADLSAPPSSRRTLSTSKEGIHGSAIAAAATAGAGGVANQPAALEYGYTRHLFQVPLPPIPPSQLAAAAQAQGQQGLSANQRRMQQQGSSAASSDASAAVAPPSKEHQKRLAIVEADLQAWMRALTFAMTGVTPSAVGGLTLVPLTNPVTSPARSSAAGTQDWNGSPAAAEEEAPQELEGPKPRYSLGAISSSKRATASPAQIQKQKRNEHTPASALLVTPPRASTAAAAVSSISSSLLAPPSLPTLSPATSDDCLSAIPISPSPSASPLPSPVPVEPTPSPSPSPSADAPAAAAAEDAPLAESATPAADEVTAAAAAATTEPAADATPASHALSPDEFSSTIVEPLFDTDPQASPHGAASPIHAEPVPPLP